MQTSQEDAVSDIRASAEFRATVNLRKKTDFEEVSKKVLTG